MCAYALALRAADVRKVFAMDYGAAEYAAENAEGQVVHLAPMLGANFLAYFVVDILNASRLPQPFLPLDWVHHTLAFCFTLAGIAFDSSNTVLAPIMGLQELPSIFLTITTMGYMHLGVQLCFLLTFLGTRVILCSIAAAAKLAQHASCRERFATLAALEEASSATVSRGADKEALHDLPLVHRPLHHLDRSHIVAARHKLLFRGPDRPQSPNACKIKFSHAIFAPYVQNHTDLLEEQYDEFLDVLCLGSVRICHHLAVSDMATRAMEKATPLVYIHSPRRSVCGVRVHARTEVS